MKKLATVAALAILAASSVSANESNQSKFGSTVSLQLADQVDQDYENSEVSISVSNNLSSQFGFQFDAHYLKYKNHSSSDDIYGAAAHITYDLNKTTSIGAFYNNLSWESNEYHDYGFEASFQAKSLKLEAIIAVDKYVEDGNAHDYQAIFANYSLSNNFTIGVGVGHYEGEDENTQEISAAYKFENGIKLKIKVIDPKDEGNISAITLSKDFGQGAKFRRPDFASIFNVW